MKSWRIARRILRQNRWLYLFLALWPFFMALLPLFSASSTGLEDAFSILREECFYGLALVAFTGSTVLGSEQRSRRVAAVLSRAVSRPQYLMALYWTSCLPLALFAASFLLSALILLDGPHEVAKVSEGMTPALFLLGAWTASGGLFFATWLPSWLASMASLALVSTSFLLEGGNSLGIGHLWTALLQGAPGSAPKPVSAADAAVAILLAAGFFWAAAAIFSRRDLNLKSG